MKKLRLDFLNRIVSIVTDQKTVIAYMDADLEKKDFLTYFPEESAGDCTDHVTFDFENSVICLKKPVEESDGDTNYVYKVVKKIPTPSILEERERIMETVGWTE